jgi:hypothetical protein
VHKTATCRGKKQKNFYIDNTHYIILLYDSVITQHIAVKKKPHMNIHMNIYTAKHIPKNSNPLFQDENTRGYIIV